jgi:mediator of RNA polymerase II transcription subunit 12
MHGKKIQTAIGCRLTQSRLDALLRLAVAHGSALLRNAAHTSETALTIAFQTLLANPVLELYPSIAEHIFDVAVIMSDYISDDVRNNVARLHGAWALDAPRAHFIIGAAVLVDGWLVLTKPVNPPATPHDPSQSSTPATSQTLSSPYQSPQMASPMPATPQQRYFNQHQQQQQQRQQMQQAQQAQQMRNYPQYPQQPVHPNRQLPAQLQRTPSYQSSQSSQSPLQQMQQMQQTQGYAQQRATQPSPVPSSQRSTHAAGQGGMGGPVGGPSVSKLLTTNTSQQREVRQYPFVQPRWEILAESSGNPNLNETAINLSLFGARKV